MADPLTDPRAAQLLATSPDEIDSLAGFFQMVSGQADQAATGLQGAHGDETWTGGAADAFRAKLGKLPGDLSTVQSSYADAAAALRTYATNVTPIKSQFQTLAQQLHSAQSQLTSAQGTLTSAQGSLTSAQSGLTSAQNAPKATPTDPSVTSAKTAVSTAQTGVTSAQGAVNRLSGEVSGLDSHGFTLLDEFDTVRNQCQTAISHAGDKAPQHHSSLFGSICHIADDVGHFVAGAAEGVWNHIKDLPSAAWAFAKDPLSLKNFTRFAEDLAVTASVVAMVAAPFAAPELAGADAAVDGAVAATDAAEGGADAAAAADASTAAGSEGSAEASQSLFTKAATQTSKWGVRTTTASSLAGAGGQAGQGHFKEAALDAAFAIAPNVGHIPTSIDDIKTLGDQTANVLGIGEKQAEATATAATGAKDFQILDQIGINSEGARSLAFEGADSTPAALRSGDPSASAIQSTVDATQAAAQRAALISTKLGRPVAIALDNLLFDPTKTALAGGGDK